MLLPRISFDFEPLLSNYNAGLEAALRPKFIVNNAPFPHGWVGNCVLAVASASASLSRRIEGGVGGAGRGINAGGELVNAVVSAYSRGEFP